jgi:hypothetical protein
LCSGLEIKAEDLDRGKLSDRPREPVWEAGSSLKLLQELRIIIRHERRTKRHEPRVLSACRQYTLCPAVAGDDGMV